MTREEARMILSYAKDFPTKSEWRRISTAISVLLDVPTFSEDMNRVAGEYARIYKEPYREIALEAYKDGAERTKEELINHIAAREELFDTVTYQLDNLTDIINCEDAPEKLLPFISFQINSTSKLIKDIKKVVCQTTTLLKK